ncbi:hypothetical protein scyTo_0019742 [Scyliorhinus torazame]|uniref:C-type lectin domain-containing protein n=1 Tax=Scyliorhinus torazame TaxID=75743 RepID=A0A401PQ32_SCYTO|nr:hypothetical protein [Scyliorhinus torazame]
MNLPHPIKPRTSSADYLYTSHTWNLITSDNWERERFEERNFKPDMMLIGVLLLAALFSSEVAADLLPKSVPEKQIDDDEDEECVALGKRMCADGVVKFRRCFIFFSVAKTWTDAEEGNYVWSNGTPTNYLRWRPRQPDNLGSIRNCVEMGHCKLTLLFVMARVYMGKQFQTNRSVDEILNGLHVVEF